MHRVKLQGPLERGARHGAAAVGGGAAFSVSPCVSRARLTPSRASRGPPGGKGGARGRRRRRATDRKGREGGRRAPRLVRIRRLLSSGGENQTQSILFPSFLRDSLRMLGRQERERHNDEFVGVRARAHGANAQLAPTKQTLRSVAAVWPTFRYAVHRLPALSLSLPPLACRLAAARSLFLPLPHLPSIDKKQS